MQVINYKGKTIREVLIVLKNLPNTEVINVTTWNDTNRISTVESEIVEMNGLLREERLRR